MRYCNYCGSILEDHATRCPICGEALVDSDEGGYEISNGNVNGDTYGDAYGKTYGISCGNIYGKTYEKTYEKTYGKMCGNTYESADGGTVGRSARDRTGRKERDPNGEDTDGKDRVGKGLAGKSQGRENRKEKGRRFEKYMLVPIIISTMIAAVVAFHFVREGRREEPGQEVQVESVTDEELSYIKTITQSAKAGSVYRKISEEERPSYQDPSDVSGGERKDAGDCRPEEGKSTDTGEKAVEAAEEKAAEAAEEKAAEAAEEKAVEAAEEKAAEMPAEVRTVEE